MSLTRLPLLTAVLIVATTFAQAQAQAPRSSAGAVEQYRLAARYQKLEQFDLAGKEWAKLVADFPKDPLAAAGRHYAGVCQFQLGNYPSAVKWFEEFQAQHPKHELLEATLTNLGLAAYNQAQAAKGDQATELYQRVLAALDQRRSAFPEGKMAAEAEFYRGETIYALGRTTEAEAAYTKWLEQYGDSPLVPNARLALGATQSELGNTDAAVGTLNSLLKTDPPNDVAAQALVRLADAHNAANQFKQAAVYYAQALEQYPEDVDRDYVGQARASAVFSAGDFAEAANLYEDLGDLASAGKSYYQAGNHGKAADRLAKAFEASSSDADLAHWWVRSLLDGGQPAEALTAAEKALETVESPATARPGRCDVRDRREAFRVGICLRGGGRGRGRRVGCRSPPIGRCDSAGSGRLCRGQAASPASDRNVRGHSICQRREGDTGRGTVAGGRSKPGGVDFC